MRNCELHSRLLITLEAQHGAAFLQTHCAYLCFSGLKLLGKWALRLMSRRVCCSASHLRALLAFFLAPSLSARCSRTATMSSYDMIFPRPTTVRFSDLRLRFSSFCSSRPSISSRRSAPSANAFPRALIAFSRCTSYGPREDSVRASICFWKVSRLRAEVGVRNGAFWHDESAS